MLEPYNGEIDEFYINVFVKNPKVEEGSYIIYEIVIETNNISFTASKSTVRRRYSEFVHLYKLLAKEFPAWKLPSLPPKYPFKDHFHPAFVEKRRNGLEEFIKKLVSEKIYLSSKALHLFLQSSHSLSEIKDIIQGNRDPTEVNDNSLTITRLPMLDSGNVSDDVSNNSVPSHAEIDVNVQSIPNHCSSELSNNPSKSCSSGSSENKRKVSFCDQVTVAQIL